MSLPRVAIVGRPNVGKSSLMNRLARKRISIVDPTPGVTRDRVSVVLEIEPPKNTPKGTPTRFAELHDTGGWGVYVVEGAHIDDAGCDLRALTDDIESQIREAMECSELIVFVTDAQSGVTPLDETVAKLLRRSGALSKTLVVANKVDSRSWEAHGHEAASLGLGEVLCVSSTSGHGITTLTNAMWEQLGDLGEVEQQKDELRLSIVGKRNAGKSSFINALAGEQRVIVSEIAGTTRDAVDVQFEINGKILTAIDTAGVRKQKSFADDIEFYAYRRMLNSIRRSDVSVLLLDATTRVSQVDKKLSTELQRQFKPTVIVVNKWDLVDDDVSPEDYLEYLTKELRGLDYAPIVFISASEGEGIEDAVAMAFNLKEQTSHRETTGKLNAVMQEILKERGPSSRLGTVAKLLFVSQIGVAPPTIAIVVNEPSMFEGQYERYLMNRLREELPFSEVPIRLLFTKRQRKTLEELKREGRTATIESLTRSNPSVGQAIDGADTLPDDTLEE
ncbi:MAG: ribosome biogenesis GTPase Der [Phycisphaerales bacterium]|jgi:GTP-binding protein|nr:ribosome biogenesis GTPase Der [Phycisphaerales bacterium]